MVIEKLKEDASVEYVEKVPLRQCISTPNDPSVPAQWSLTKIKAFQAWDINPGSSDIIVAVVDNAIQSNHVDLQNNMLAGYDIADADNNTNPPDSTFAHGTHVSGIVGAVCNNNIGIASAGNNHIKILPVKATPNAGYYNSIYFGYEGIRWAADNGAKIISCSWGGAGFSQTEQDVIDYVYSKGIIMVAAAGNDNTSVRGYPAAYNHVIAVASTDDDDSKSSFSTYGSWVDIAAPGRGILSTIPFNKYANFNGTSMATPLVASVLGFIWSSFPTLTPAQLETILKNTADNIDAKNASYVGQLGAGRVNLLRAIACPNGGISSATIAATGSTYICQGESVLLSSTNTTAGLTYSWIKDGQPLDITTATLTANTSGSYQLSISAGSCTLLSNDITVVLNQQLTPSPTVIGRNLTCDRTLSVGNGLQATAASCNYGGPTTFNYVGGTVGYDGFNSSGSNPSVIVSSLGGKVSHVAISITWQKIDGGIETSCGIGDGGGRPYNEEVSFKLRSPTGTIITLLAEDTYASGITTSGVVTTLFQDGGTVITSSSLPTSGTFAPNQPLSTLVNEIPVGTWTLLPQDNGAIDPLCVQGFSITITTDSPNQSPLITWWDAASGGNQIAAGTEYIPSIINEGTQTYYAQAQCSGLCPSTRIPVILTLNKTLNIVQQPISQDVCHGQGAYFSIISSCSNVTYHWQENQGSGWNDLSEVNAYTGTTTTNLSIIPASINQNNYQYRCVVTDSLGNQSVFSDLVNLTVKYSADAITVTHVNAVSGEVVWNQAVLYLIATNKTVNNSTLDFRAGNSIVLNPGFEVQSGSVFRAKIERPCTNTSTFAIPTTIKY